MDLAHRMFRNGESLNPSEGAKALFDQSCCRGRHQHFPGDGANDPVGSDLHLALELDDAGTGHRTKDAIDHESWLTAEDEVEHRLQVSDTVPARPLLKEHHASPPFSGRVVPIYGFKRGISVVSVIWRLTVTGRTEAPAEADMAKPANRIGDVWNSKAPPTPNLVPGNETPTCTPTMLPASTEGGPKMNETAGPTLIPAFSRNRPTPSVLKTPTSGVDDP